jgi:imidazoleglycerol-phosphate dehydratase / histidinol-phosphatase
MKKVLFIDRDGTILIEPDDEQVDSLEKLSFVPGAIYSLSSICSELDFELVMVTNQDGLGTKSFPEETFWPAQNKMMEILEGEGIHFSEVLIDRTFPGENAPTRKPGTGMVSHFIKGNYDLENSYVIGDRLTDVQFAKNIGCKAIWLNDGVSDDAVLTTVNWNTIYRFLKEKPRRAVIKRKTFETDIFVSLNIDGEGSFDINTGLGFFDHMLSQTAKHGGLDLVIKADGDLKVDEHHTVEDVALALGKAFSEALGNKRGIERYGFYLPMDDSLAQLSLDFSGRPWLVWDVEFKREKIGDVPTEMFLHFFKSFCDAAGCNLNVKAEGLNEHHKAEAVFKAFGKAIKAAVRRDGSKQLPTTKGAL